ncbi:SusD/RagB family nutrient-binding outer membrane lipoprotein [Larkinella sp. VNQ87]|uniref:SusD/RagB family nutrient-binding outer membrane lipoprotein n=1 Tax=Larkinella sp. VNQ87 TaxID=3400921 RepID=UPI003C0DCF1E
MKTFFSNTLRAFVLAAGFLLGGCEADFEDLNVDPNNPSSPNMPAVLTGAIRGWGGTPTAALPVLYTQQMSEVQYTTESRYNTIPQDFNGFYTGPLTSLQFIINQNTDPETKSTATVLAGGGNNNQLAVARIQKAYLFSIITDRWGNVPYSDALKGRENFKPKYDAQKDIYYDLFKELKEAVAQFDGGAAVQGDILFGGNAARWKQFANSLRLILALRLSKVDPTKGKAEFVEALNAGVINSNTANILYPYLSDANYENAWNSRFDTRIDYAISNTLGDFLIETKDPRLTVFANLPSGASTYITMPYGVDSPSAVTARLSLPGYAIRNQASPAFLITYAQMLFSQAEAVKLGWITGDAKKLYEDGIKASWEQWSAQIPLIQKPDNATALDLEVANKSKASATEAFANTTMASYLAQPKVKWDEAKALELIGTQKWIALYTQGYESWSEWRRTGYPALKPAPAAMNTSGQIPRRQGYPLSEQTINTDNYKAAVAAQGPDDLDTRVWWDKK